MLSLQKSLSVSNKELINNESCQSISRHLSYFYYFLTMLIFLLSLFNLLLIQTLHYINLIGKALYKGKKRRLLQ